MVEQSYLAADEMEWRPMANNAVRSEKCRLICLPYAGGSSIIFRNWPSRVGSEVVIVPVELPGRQRRLAEAPLSNVEVLLKEVVPDLVEQTASPYALFGHSMGALLAYEIALALTRAVGRAPVLLVVSACRAPMFGSRQEPIHRLPEAEFWEEIYRLNGTANGILQYREMRALLEPALRADFELAETYARADPPRLPCPLIVCSGEDDRLVTAEELAGWGRVTTNSCQSLKFSGDHFFLNDAGAKLPEMIATALTSFLRDNLVDAPGSKR